MLSVENIYNVPVCSPVKSEFKYEKIDRRRKEHRRERNFHSIFDYEMNYGETSSLLMMQAGGLRILD